MQWDTVGESGEVMLIGSFYHNLDEKNRLVIPTKYRDILGSQIIITHGIERCLYVYSMDRWNDLVTKLNTLPLTKKNARTFVRAMFASASDCKFDKSGRITIEKPQTSYASLDKECVIIGVNDRLEIWSKETYEKYSEESADTLEEVSEHLFEDNDAL